MSARDSLLLFSFVFSLLSPLFSVPGEKPTTCFQDLRTTFPNPDLLYAPAFFWFWDQPIDNPQAHRQIAAMAHSMTEQRVNPGYVHARFNMVGEPDLPFEQWLSPDWFAAFDGALAAAEQANAYLGYVDEYWWPSGRAAGRVLEKNPHLWAESLYWQTIDVTGGHTIDVPASFFVVAAKLAKNTNGIVEQKINLENNSDISKDEMLNAECRMMNEESRRRKAARRMPSAESPARTANREPRPACPDSLLLAPHLPATISSQTLHIIGTDEPFQWRAPTNGPWRIYVFQKYYHPGCDGGRLNYLDMSLSETFLKEAHEPYAEKFPAQLGRRIPGVFVDHEGDYGYKLAWSDDLATHYQQKTGRDMRLWMPLLVEKDQEGRFAKARWQWFDSVSDIYVKFFKGTTQWCAEHGMYAISNLWEESLMWQASAVGDFFKAQRVFSMPGTDALGLRVLQPHDFMETKSVCEFENRRFQSEIMGGSGFWGFNNITIKQAANAAITWGVNHVVPHAVWLTRKLDGNPWLPDWFKQNPWWPQLHVWADFVRRASYVNSHGHVVADVLLLNPMDSVWGLCGPGVFDPAFQGRTPVPAVQPVQTKQDVFRTPEQVKKQSAWWCPPKMDAWYSEEVHNINKIYSQAIDDLVRHRIEFLITDRHYVRQMHITGDALVRDPFRFRTIILPAMHILPRDVLQKVTEFAKSGGHVYVLYSWPSGSTDVGLYDGKIDSMVKQLQGFSNVVFCDSSLAPELLKMPAHVRSHIEFKTGEFDMLQQHRRIDGRNFYWLANNTSESRTCELRQPKDVTDFEKWDCETGEINYVFVSEDASGKIIELQFAPNEGFWLVERAEAAPKKLKTQKQQKCDTLDIDPRWFVRIDETRQPPVEHPMRIPEQFLHGDSLRLSDWQGWGLGSFSGLATYEIAVRMADEHENVLLDLGEVHVGARLWVNNTLIGDRLWPPYQFDCRNIFQSGENSIRIDVGNLLNNCYGDKRPSGLPGPVKMIK